MSPAAFARLKICQKCVCGRGSAPDPTGELINPYLDLTGGFAAGEEKRRGRKGKGRERTGMERRERGKRRMEEKGNG